ncbi:MAG: glycosyltransferase [Candidatus Hydrogenedentes bacterium]|nr:glycosyltransferase [Candidatus Hydrogenedentota bacterium]
MPVFNARETLAEAIASIQAQDYPDWELIVVDDGSTDGGGDLAMDLARSDPRIRVRRDLHRGLVPALAAGCAAARGAFIARMDADDTCAPERFSRQLAWFADNPGGGLCGTRVRAIGGPVRVGRRRYIDWLNANTDHDAIDRELFIECPIAHPAFMMRRDAFEGLGGYREFDGPEDYDLVFRFWRAGYRLGNVPETLLNWRETPGRHSMASSRYSEAAFRRLKRAWLDRAGIGRDRPWFQWGAGEVGKRWLREWPPGEMEAVVDIRPGKIGQEIHGCTVIRPEDLPPPGACFVLIAVGTPGARDIIRAWCADHGYRECADYRFIA